MLIEVIIVFSKEAVKEISKMYISCENCGEEFNAKKKKMKRNEAVTCPHCNAKYVTKPQQRNKVICGCLDCCPRITNIATTMIAMIFAIIHFWCAFQANPVSFGRCFIHNILCFYYITRMQTKTGVFVHFISMCSLIISCIIQIKQ